LSVVTDDRVPMTQLKIERVKVRATSGTFRSLAGDLLGDPERR